MKKDEFLDKKCPVCGKSFAVLYPNRWAYKRPQTSTQYTYYCSWTCLRASEIGKEDGKMKKLTEEQKQHAIEIALQGESPVTYLEHGCGINNGNQCWRNIRDRLKTDDPETFKKLEAALPKRPGGRKPKPVIEKDIDKVYAAEQEELEERDVELSAEPEAEITPYGPEDPVPTQETKVVFAPDGEHILKITEPLTYDGFTVDAIKGAFGRYARDKFNGTDYLDYETNDGEEISMPVGARREFLKELYRAAGVLGVDLE